MAERRILLKLSGELLGFPQGAGVDPHRMLELCRRIERGLAGGATELAVVIGGGNLVRGARLTSGAAGEILDRVTGDQMGMLATVMNGLAMRSALRATGVGSHLMSAVPCGELAGPFAREEAMRELESGRVALLAGGTGHPFFTTDTTAVLRALQIGADFVAKGTKVRGVFSADPESDPDAEFFERLTYREVLERRLRVMDLTAISLCMDHGLPIRVFDVQEPGNLERVLAGESVGTLVE